MTLIGPTVFSAIVWGSLSLVALVFAYELAVVVSEWRSRRRG